jgi:hypothetical protein
MLPLAIIGALSGISLWKNRKKKAGVMTPQRQVIYDAALTAEKDPENLKILAKAFHAEGLHAQAELLEKRAALRDLPPEIQAARKQIVRDALKSDNPIFVAQMAGEFDAVGASGAAHALYQHASGLRAKQSAMHGDLNISIKHEGSSHAGEAAPLGGTHLEGHAIGG